MHFAQAPYALGIDGYYAKCIIAPMQNPVSFSQIIDQWPTVAAFADSMGVPYQTASAMKRRNSIDPDYWERLIQQCEKRGIEGVTWELLAKLAAGITETTPIEALKKTRVAQPTLISNASPASLRRSSKNSTSTSEVAK
jgi:hypothetical protein